MQTFGLHAGAQIPHEYQWKRSKKMKRKLFGIAILIAIALFAIPAMLSVVAPVSSAQTMTSGDIAGVVSDSTGAVVPNATVSLKSAGTGETRVVQTNASGAYRFNLLKPGTYQVFSTSPGLKSDILSNIVVAVGQVQTVDLVLKPTEAKEVITVTEAAPLLQTENANLASSFSTKQLELLPAPGGDITTAAFTVPGVVVSTGAGYGNFSAHGLPGTSNLFTMNGNDNTDSYLNLNNSGASNLTLGGSEVDQVSVVQNAYSAQYGRNAGAQVNFITKSGSNAFHGELLYNYNGSAMNANDFFANAAGTPRGRAVSNQYGASVGGFAKKDKVFFFVNTEGMRYVLPTTGVQSLPSQALQNYILGNISAAQVPYYQKGFDLFNKAPGANRAVPVTNGDGLLQDSYNGLGCGTLAGTPAGGGKVFGEDVSCANAYVTNVSNLNKEWIFGSRVDYNINSNQKIFFRFKTDHGLQPTATDPINPVFNAESNQPQYEGQINHTWVATPQLVNSFIGSVMYYSAVFGPKDLSAALQAFPSMLNIYDGGANGTGGFTQLGISLNNYPQGRRIGQLQLVDDLSWNVGRHSLKFGVNYRSNRLTDTGNQRLVYGGRYYILGLDEFANGQIDPGTGSLYQQRSTPFPVVHLRAYNAGFYGQDEWAVTPKLKLTLGLRFDRTGNPYCTDKCFAVENSPWDTIQKGINVPYNQSIATGRGDAFYSVEPLVVQPRFGIVYSPSWSKHTVIRGGVGLFSDLPPLTLVSALFGSNAPNVFTPSIRTGSGGNNLLINSSGAGSGPAIAQATGSAFMSGFSNGYTVGQIKSALSPVAFTEPAYTTIPSEMRSPKYLEWSFEIQQELSEKNVVTLSYVGNHGYDLILRNLKVNGWVNTALTYANGFGGLPTVAPDPRFRVVTDISNSGFSNYDGLSLSYRRGMAFGFQGEFSYTWSHALDTVSNGGILAYSGDSFTSTFNPLSVRNLNYSSSDYDIRHNFTADFLWDIPLKMQNKALNSMLSGWSLSSKWYVRTGTPFSVYNSRIPGRISVAIGGSVLADVLDPNVQTSCTSVDKACFSTSQFAAYNKQTDWGNWPRNSFRAPGYFDTDASLYKAISLSENVRFRFGASAYNILNHPNFASPGYDAATSGFGTISSTVGAPTSPYGSFQGSAVSGRVLVVSGRFNF